MLIGARLFVPSLVPSRLNRSLENPIKLYHTFEPLGEVARSKRSSKKVHRKRESKGSFSTRGYEKRSKLAVTSSHGRKGVHEGRHWILALRVAPIELSKNQIAQRRRRRRPRETKSYFVAPVLLQIYDLPTSECMCVCVCGRGKLHGTTLREHHLGSREPQRFPSRDAFNQDIEVSRVLTVRLVACNRTCFGFSTGNGNVSWRTVP